MKKLIFFAAVVALVLFSCSPDKTSPSSRLLGYHDALRDADIRVLQKTLSGEAYLELVRSNIPRMKGSGKVFAYDVEHFETDLVSLRRMAENLQQLLLAERNAGTVTLIGQDATEEKRRILHYLYEGKKRSATFEFMGGEWKIVRFSSPESGTD